MRLAIISDIHANREALDTVLASIENQSVDKIICLGDLVDYGVEPSYCIEKVRDIANVILYGNHDEAAATEISLHWFNREARKSVLWTREKLSDEEKEYLKTLELSHIEDSCLFVHSTPDPQDDWYYITNWFDAAEQFDNFDQNVCFLGHSHVPGFFSLNSNQNEYREGKIPLQMNDKIIINVGSVGQPRDRDPRACYVIADHENSTVEFIRVPYDVEKTANKISSEGVSYFHARRILLGI